jgi:hypothetical protein
MPVATCICGSCFKCKRNAYMAEWYTRNAESVRARVKRYRECNIEKIREYDRGRGFRPSSPEKIRARAAINHAIETGQIQRPASCENCGAKHVVGADGRTLIQAHHEDYSKPLAVRWLCVVCHGRVHRKVA